MKFLGQTLGLGQPFGRDDAEPDKQLPVGLRIFRGQSGDAVCFHSGEKVNPVSCLYIRLAFACN